MKKIFLTILAVIGLFIVIYPRFYHLGSQPPGLHIDEVSFAADAKAIAETGRDTWNKPWPLVFKAFGEWKAPGLTYSMAFWSKILGRMDTTIARLPSAIAGLSILVIYFYTLRLILPSVSIFIPIISTIILAFSPWHFDMSRIFYEAFSALAFFSLAIYFYGKALISKISVDRSLIIGTIFAAISGYFYASIRYVAIFSVIVVALLAYKKMNLSVKKSATLFIILLFVGSGWIGDLFSSRGLNRLNYYNQKAAFGSALEIDEKRQFCYLSLNKDSLLTKPCNYLWNKPVEKMINAAKVYTTYLGTDYLFVKAESEYGFDANYGAFLLPVLLLFIIGIVSMLTQIFHRSKNENNSNYYLLLILIALFSLLPSAMANNINMRMSLIALYIVSLINGVGLASLLTWLASKLSKLSIYVFILYLCALLFFIVQSLAHYFLVFTHSNDLMWTSDAEAIFSYVKTQSPNYDRIIDTDLHGPLAPYFYGDISTSDVQRGLYSDPDAIGFVYLIRAGKYELIHRNPIDLACEKLGNKDDRKTLVITSKIIELAGIRNFVAYTWNGVDIMREVYDLDKIIAYELDHNSSFKTTCSPK